MKGGFCVDSPGVLTLIQDAGRFGCHRLGLTNGGPADPLAFNWANRLCGNDSGGTALEVTIGGLELECQVATVMALCGADMPLTINRQPKESWRSHRVKSGDRIALGYARSGMRAYLAVANGFNVPPTFGSTATVLREGLGGLSGNPLQAGDHLPCPEVPDRQCLSLERGYRPVYGRRTLLRVVCGYQSALIPDAQQQRFFASEYRLLSQSDRMACRLAGPPIEIDIPDLLSEGVCLGTLQIPPDGLPIILMHDRQTIGGYPKLGSVISLDISQLAQLKPGGRVSFKSVTMEEARHIRLVADRMYAQLKPQVCD
ncbi:biotin-dependent carboxyltransferase family protein [Porticoccus sp.]|uniref:5-oxoprolinase subunit C family protein n=1 Tax=Porticoccus sp. TaxID=2024853 RepID=UPI003F6990BF